MVARTDGIRAGLAIAIVEAAYRLDGTEAEWLARWLEVARPDLDTGCGIYAFTGDEDVPNFPASPVFVQHGLDAGFGERLLELNREAPSAIYDLIRRRVATCGGLEQLLGADSPIVAHFRGLMAPTGIKDGFSMFSQDAEGGNVTVSAPSRHVVAPAPRVRGVWRRVGLHVAAALRLRRKLAARATSRGALLLPSGKLEDADPALKDDASARGVLVRAVKAMEQARSSATRSSPERALELWQGLVAGEWSLVDQWESDGRRYLAAYRNRPALRDPRALTTAEQAILKYLALGATNKDIMYALGLPAGTVSGAVTQILKKLGVHRRVDVAVLAERAAMDRLDVSLEAGDLGVLAIDASPTGSATEALSAAELEVAAYVVRGFSNARIARARDVSLNTVNNQLRSIYDKLGITTRSQLARVMTKGSASE